MSFCPPTVHGATYCLINLVSKYLNLFFLITSYKSVTLSILIDLRLQVEFCKSKEMLIEQSTHQSMEEMDLLINNPRITECSNSYALVTFSGASELVRVCVFFCT